MERRIRVPHDVRTPVREARIRPDRRLSGQAEKTSIRGVWPRQTSLLTRTRVNYTQAKTSYRHADLLPVAPLSAFEYSLVFCVILVFSIPVCPKGDRASKKNPSAAFPHSCACVQSTTLGTAASPPPRSAGMAGYRTVHLHSFRTRPRERVSRRRKSEAGPPKAFPQALPLQGESGRRPVTNPLRLPYTLGSVRSIKYTCFM